MTDKPVEQMSFEEAMTAFEAIVHKLDSGDVPLEESIALYERGAALRARCEAKLQEAEEKVALITRDASGKPTGTEPLDP